MSRSPPLPICADLLERPVVAEVPQRLPPGRGVEVNRVDQRPVDVEDDGLDHTIPRSDDSRARPVTFSPCIRAIPGPRVGPATAAFMQVIMNIGVPCTFIGEMGEFDSY